MDPIPFGATVGAVMELYEMGVLTKEQLGIDAKFGSAQALAIWPRDHRQGRRLRQGDRPGLASAADRQSTATPELSDDRQGQEFPAYDARGIQGMGLTYATSNRGACHLRSYTVASEGAGHPGQDRPAHHEGKPELVRPSRTPPPPSIRPACASSPPSPGPARSGPQVAAACG